MKNLSLALIAAATLAAGGFAVAQSNPPTSTPGAGCTATANAMKGGNLGGTATNKDCVSSPATTAVVPAPAPMVSTTPAPAPMVANTPAPAPMVAQAPARPAPMRVARADRN
ncbi:hypothetical protein [Caenimonas sp. SL110]|uniref:hypothetical protein n=1 Tax=Caenimonas sp. SL110 TaxID=1450524 RepID=UPI000652EA2B|nr:hypothetical protein [Caenimonas sp. SL110]